MILPRRRTFLRQEGKVIMPVREGEGTISLVICLHFLQTQAQATMFWRRSPSLLSTRCMISASSSGSIPAHERSGWPAPPPLPDPTASSESRTRPLFSFSSLKDLENLREKKDLLRDIALQTCRERERRERERVVEIGKH